MRDDELILSQVLISSMLFLQYPLSLTVLSILIKLKEHEEIIITEVLALILLSLFYSCLVHALLVNLPSVDHLFNASNSDKSVNDDISLLPDPVDTVNGLVVICWVPIWVEDDDSISPDQVEAVACNPCG